MPPIPRLREEPRLDAVAHAAANALLLLLLLAPPGRADAQVRPALQPAAPAPADCPADIPTRPLGFDDVLRTVRKPPRYTQGLLVHGGRLYESSGAHGHSGIFVSGLDGADGRQLARLDDRFFGEGLAVHDGHAYYLTWRARRAFRYRLREDGTLSDVTAAGAPLRYRGEGWGLTSFRGHLLMSDGTAQLRVIQPVNFTTLRTIPVRAGTRPLEALNELETVGDRILANVYGSSHIYVIEPASGCVEATLDASVLARFVLSRLPPKDELVCSMAGHCQGWDFVLNGIAHDAAKDQLYLTGKNWPYVFVIDNPLRDVAAPP